MSVLAVLSALAGLLRLLVGPLLPTPLLRLAGFLLATALLLLARLLLAAALLLVALSALLILLVRIAGLLVHEFSMPTPVSQRALSTLVQAAGIRNLITNPAGRFPKRRHQFREIASNPLRLWRAADHTVLYTRP
jgi:hypothetical protein